MTLAAGFAGVDFADGVAGLGIGGSGDGARVHHNDVRGGAVGCGEAAAVAQLAL